MIIDSHQHFWKYNSSMDSWISDEMKAIRQDFLASDLETSLKQNGIDGCIAVQADQTESETEFLVKLAEENDFVKGVVGWLDLRADNIQERLEIYSNNQYLKGLRHIVQAEPKGFMLDNAFLNGIETLGKHDMTYDILIHSDQLEEATLLVKRFKNQRFVLDHMAKPYINGLPERKWVSELQLLSNHENVFCKISGMVTETADFNWKPKDFTPYLDTVIDAFGVDRVLFGSDWPVCLVTASYKDVLGILQSYFKAFSEQEQSKIFGLNTINFYKL